MLQLAAGPWQVVQSRGRVPSDGHRQGQRPQWPDVYQLGAEQSPASRARRSGNGWQFLLDSGANVCGGSRREEFKILQHRPLDRLERDRGIESGQPAFVRYREREQIDVRKLPMPLNVSPAEPSGIEHAHRIGPENMLTVRTEGSQTRGCVFDCGSLAGIGRIGKYSDECVLGERTSRPSAAAIASEPGVSRLVMQVRGIE
jgi:hypothetical protein